MFEKEYLKFSKLWSIIIDRDIQFGERLWHKADSKYRGLVLVKGMT